MRFLNAIRPAVVALALVVPTAGIAAPARADLQVQPVQQQTLTPPAAQATPAPALTVQQAAPPTQNLTVQPAQSSAAAPATTDPQATAPAPEQEAPAEPQPAAPAQDTQPAAPAPDAQAAAPAQDVQPAAPAQDVQPAASAQDVQPAAPAQDLQPAAPAQDVQPAAPVEDVQPATGAPAAEQSSASAPAAPAPTTDASSSPSSDHLEVTPQQPAPPVVVAPAPPAPNVVVAPVRPQQEIHVGSSAGHDIGVHLHVEAPHQLPTITVSQPAPVQSLTVAPPQHQAQLHVNTSPSTGTEQPLTGAQLQPAITPDADRIGAQAGSGMTALLQPAAELETDDAGIMLQPAALGLNIPHFGSMPAGPGEIPAQPETPAQPGVAQQVWNVVFGPDMTPQDLLDSLPPEVGGAERGGVGLFRAAGDGLSDFARLLRGGDQAADGAVDLERGWKVGQLPDVYAPTKAGNLPSWSTVRARYWQQAAEAPDAAAEYGTDNLIRMRLGLAPQRFNPMAPGGVESMELSHEPVPARDGGTEFTERWPCDHAKEDPFRRPGYC